MCPWSQTFFSKVDCSKKFALTFAVLRQLPKPLIVAASDFIVSILFCHVCLTLFGQTTMIKSSGADSGACRPEEDVDLALQHAGIRINDVDECGFGRCRPRCLQPCANIKTFILICCMLSSTSSALTAGYVSSVITTIEKRFDIGSFISGLIAASVEVGCIVSVVFVSYFGAKGHIPTWLGIGAAFQGLGALIFALPHVTATRYSLSGNVNATSDDNLCGGEGLSALAPEDAIVARGACQSMASGNISYVFILMLAQLLIGSGGSPIFTLGTTYIDNHVTKCKAPSYIGELLHHFLPLSRHLMHVCFSFVCVQPSSTPQEPWALSWALPWVPSCCSSMLISSPSTRKPSI